MYSVCGGGGMVSGESDMVLSHDSGGIVATSDFTVGMSYAVSIWFVFQRDAMNIYSNFIFILRFFVAMFYSVEWVADGVKWVIQHNPLYAYIYVMRQCVVYGQWPETMYLVQMVAWAFGMLAFGILIFKNMRMM